MSSSRMGQPSAEEIRGFTRHPIELPPLGLRPATEESLKHTQISIRRRNKTLGGATDAIVVPEAECTESEDFNSASKESWTSPHARSEEG